MRNHSRRLASLLIAAVSFGLLGISGCAARGTIRVYDPDDGEYRNWNRTEVRYYQEWEVDTHRDDEAYERRSPDEQREYWRWRHDHHHDRDHDHDRDSH